MRGEASSLKMSHQQDCKKDHGWILLYSQRRVIYLAKYDYFVIDIGIPIPSCVCLKTDDSATCTVPTTIKKRPYTGDIFGKAILFQPLAEISIDAVHTIATSSAAGVFGNGGNGIHGKGYKKLLKK